MRRELTKWILVLFTWNTLLFPLPQGYGAPTDPEDEAETSPTTEVAWKGSGPAPVFDIYGRTMFEIMGIALAWERDDLQDVKKYHLGNLRSANPPEYYLNSPARYTEPVELVQHIWDVFSETKTRDLYKRFIVAIGTELKPGHGEIHAQLMHRWKEYRYQHAEYFTGLTKAQIYSEFKSFLWKSEWRNLYSRALLENFRPASGLREDRIGAMVLSHLSFAKGAIAVGSICAALVVGFSWGFYSGNPGPQERMQQRLDMDDLSRVHAAPEKSTDAVLEGARSRGELFEAQFP